MSFSGKALGSMEIPAAHKDQLSSESPDVALASKPMVAGRLDWVGMSDLASPVKIKTSGGVDQLTPATVEVGVSLDDAGARGIHMSRIFTLVQQQLTSEVLSLKSLKKLLERVIETQEGLGASGKIQVKWSLPVLKTSLLSKTSGWQIYPAQMSVELNNGKWQAKQGLEVLYSSTCPCSAALSHQVLLDAFRDHFQAREQLAPNEVTRWLEQTGWLATPHAQRSVAKVEVEVEAVEFAPSCEELIETIESALGTAVQTAVKRADEQEFARRNAQNLMFCEDAARRLKSAFQQDGRFRDFVIEVEHQESLHGHNAKARASKTP